jgi:hypothetical protein
MLVSTCTPYAPPRFAFLVPLPPIPLPLDAFPTLHYSL